MKKTKKVYVAGAYDILHIGHINIFKIANKFGEVTVGLLTDKAISSYKKLPYLNFKKRKFALKKIKYIKNIIPQHTLDYTSNLTKIKPHYVVHGDDWKRGVQKNTRSRIIKLLKKWSGKLIEPKYIKNISSTNIRNKIENNNLKKLKLELIGVAKVIKIGISQISGKEIKSLESVNATAGKGLENDRFCKNNNKNSSQLTLIEKEKIDDFNNLLTVSIPYEKFRRNIITEGIKLNNLINKEILIGNVKIKVHELCEPCRHLQEILKQKNLVKNLIHKGGLRCEILTSGKISVGDIIIY